MAKKLRKKKAKLKLLDVGDKVYPSDAWHPASGPEEYESGFIITAIRSVRFYLSFEGRDDYTLTFEDTSHTFCGPPLTREDIKWPKG